MGKFVSRWRLSLATQLLNILSPMPIHFQDKTNTRVPMVLVMAHNTDTKDLANAAVIELELRLIMPGKMIS